MYEFEVTSEHLDGVHILGRFSTYDEARSFAEDWIGKYAEWLNPSEAIDMFGGVLRIEKVD
jgi:hypothetical protein